jgi:hypothetical protein
MEGRAVEGMKINRNEETSQLAYRIWQEEGCPHGRDVEHWLEAERLWQAENRPKRKTKQAKSVQSKPVKSSRTERRKRRPTEITTRPQ